MTTAANRQDIWSSNWPGPLSAMVRWLGLPTGALALVFAWIEVEKVQMRWLHVVIWLLLVVFTVYLEAILAERHPLAAAYALVAMSSISSLALLVLSGSRATLLPFVLPLLAAGLLLDPGAAIAFVALLLVALATLSTQLHLGLDWLEMLAYVALPALTTAGCQRVLRQELARAWHHDAEAAKLAGQVNARREEVNRLNKALRLSNHLLKHSNYELALARLEAEEARHAKERFATYVSHELRTPLNIILGFAEIMQKYPETYGTMQWTPLLRRDVAEVQHSARYLADLVDDILDLARIEALRMPVHREWVMIEELLHESADVAKRLLVGKPVQFVLDYAVGEQRLFIDRTRIRQVVLNLLANASRFTEQGTITLGARDSGQELTVFVSDTGPGIPADQIEAIFEDFRQADSGQAQKGRSGSGLGLAIARRFVQAHGGHIWAESELGRGTTISFTLPRIPKQVVASSLPAHQPIAAPDKPAIMLLDRDPSAAAYLRRWLDGYTILVATDMSEAKTLMHNSHPRAILLNLPASPQFDSYVNTAVNELGAEAPIIRCTLPFGAWLFDDRLFDSWLVKPVSSAQLTAALEGLGEAPRLLIVDDDRAFVQLAVRMLRATTPRAEVAWAHTAEDALARLQQDSWDALLLDIALPDLDGRSLARLVRDADGERVKRILAVSGLQPGEDRDQLLATGFSLSKRSGLREMDLLALLRSTLSIIEPGGWAAEAGAEPSTETGAIPVS